MGQDPTGTVGSCPVHNPHTISTTLHCRLELVSLRDWWRRSWRDFQRMTPTGSCSYLLNREEEREMLSLCIDQGIAVMPWSPLARGRLTRPWGETSACQETDKFGNMLYTEFSGN
jgi:hypothetical protein